MASISRQSNTATASQPASAGAGDRPNAAERASEAPQWSHATNSAIHDRSFRPFAPTRHRGGLRLYGDAEAFADAEDFVEDRHRNAERLCRRYLGEMSRDVIRGRLALWLRKPTLGETDEDTREAPGPGRVVAMAEVTGTTGEEDDDRHHQFWLDGP